MIKLKTLSRVLLWLALLSAVLISLLVAVLIGLNYQKLLPTSQADVYILNKRLTINFKIVPSDQVLVNQFSTNLGLNPDWTQGLTVSLDDASLNYLSKSLPVKVNLAFSPKSLAFHSQRRLVLDSVLANRTYQYASRAGKLILKPESDHSFSLKITDPEPLLLGATESGQIFLSPKIRQWFPTLRKIATIEINAFDGNLDGKVQLK